MENSTRHRGRVDEGGGSDLRGEALGRRASTCLWDRRGRADPGQGVVRARSGPGINRVPGMFR
ncbi:hypothetical protein FRAAL1740 [Frankia alni ACN14a]|uniref:Uncharacterized protein n=1 Tax=Frankia alni (strain DSM 45986 / CECT 9034 / ACN14a) TaxID=326424 RepID=Q0RPY6_FRAAA|nr:hypothetical protein FRAAL1740 [Frankia alni ACN14a]